MGGGGDSASDAGMGTMLGGSVLGLAYGQGNSLGMLGGTGSQTGLMGTGQFHADPYWVNPAAFAPNGQEQQYIQQLQSQAYGQAPSAAQQQMQQGLAQAGGQSQALAASQRGISPALAARYAGMNQAGMSQNIAGQSAIQRAQEQQGYMGQLGNEMQSVRGGQMAQQNLQAGNYNYAQGINEQGYASASKNRAGMGGGAMSMLAMMSKGGMVDDASKQIDPSAYNGQPNMKLPEQDNSAYAGPNGKQMSGAMNAMAKGGEVGPQSHTAKFLKQALACGGEVQHLSFGGLSGDGGPGWGQMQPNNQPMPQIQYGAKPDMGNQMGNLSGKTGVQGQQIQSTPWTYGNMSGADTNNPGYQFYGKKGGVVPGQAEKSGDSLKNDKVPTMLSPKEIVIPRSITMGKEPGQKAKEFVDKIMASHKGKKNGPK